LVPEGIQFDWRCDTCEHEFQTITVHGSDAPLQPD
jgi:hypothetical protein